MCDKTRECWRAFWSVAGMMQSDSRPCRGVTYLKEAKVKT